MRNNFLAIGVLAAVLFVALFEISFADAATVCSEITTRLRASTDRIDELLKLKKELNEKFEQYVTEDYKAQTENLFDELHRSAAIKVAFARKKLEKSLQTQKSSLEAVSQEYFTKCGGDPSAPSVKAAVCSRCPDSSVCL